MNIEIAEAEVSTQPTVKLQKILVQFCQYPSILMLYCIPFSFSVLQEISLPKFRKISGLSRHNFKPSLS
jgi:hypothetical protein